MSTTITWEPTSEGGAICCGCQSLKESLEKVFGPFPVILGASELPQLRAMEAAATAQYAEKYRKIMNLIDVYGPIRLDASY